MFSIMCLYFTDFYKRFNLRLNVVNIYESYNIHALFIIFKLSFSVHHKSERRYRYVYLKKKKRTEKDLDMSKNCISNVLFWKVALVILVQAVPRIVDLSHRLNNAPLTWPGSPPPPPYQFTVIVRGFYENSWFV